MNTRTLAGLARAHQGMSALFSPDIIPPTVLVEINAYAEKRVTPSDTVHAILCNDLMLAIVRADERTLRALPAIAAYLVLHVPEAARGSVDAVSAWIAGARSQR